MASTKPIPPDMHVVTPHLVCAGAANAIEFYKKAFGAVEEARLPGPDGKTIMHAMIRINGAAIMLVDEMPQWGALGPKALKGSPVTIHLYVEDADAFFTRKEHGMGLGLSLSRSIVEAHGGRMWIDPPEGPGATFRFTLPR